MAIKEPTPRLKVVHLRYPLAIICVWGRGEIFFAFPILSPRLFLSSLPLPIGCDMAEKLGMLIFPSLSEGWHHGYEGWGEVKIRELNLFCTPTLNLPGVMKTDYSCTLCYVVVLLQENRFCIDKVEYAAEHTQVQMWVCFSMPSIYCSGALCLLASTPLPTLSSSHIFPPLLLTRGFRGCYSGKCLKYQTYVGAF